MSDNTENQKNSTGSTTEKKEEAQKCECHGRFRCIRMLAAAGMAIVMMYVGVGQIEFGENVKIVSGDAKVCALQLLFWFGVFVVLSRILLFTMRDED